MLGFTVLLLHAGSESAMVTNHPLLLPQLQSSRGEWSWYHGVRSRWSDPERSGCWRCVTSVWRHTAPGASASVCSWVVSWGGSELSRKHQPLTYCHQSLCTKPEKWHDGRLLVLKRTILNKRFLCPATGIIEWTSAHLKDGSGAFFFSLSTLSFPGLTHRKDAVGVNRWNSEG